MPFSTAAMLGRAAQYSSADGTLDIILIVGSSRWIKSPAPFSESHLSCLLIVLPCRLVFLGYGVCSVILLVLVFSLTKRVELQRKPLAQVELALSQGVHQGLARYSRQQAARTLQKSIYHILYS